MRVGWKYSARKQSQAEGHDLSKGKPMYEPAKAPRFELGDRVLALAPTTPHGGKEGVVVEVLKLANGTLYRYVVRFVDGTTATFFGFELELV